MVLLDWYVLHLWPYWNWRVIDPPVCTSLSLCDWIGCRGVVVARNRHRWPCLAVSAYPNEKKAAMLSLCISDWILTRCPVSFILIYRSVDFIRDAYQQCSWNRKWSELEIYDIRASIQEFYGFIRHIIVSGIRPYDPSFIRFSVDCYYLSLHPWCWHR